VEGGGGVLVSLPTAKGLAGQVFLAFLQRKLGALVPGFALGVGLLGLILDPFLAGDRRGNGLAKFHQIGLHVGDRLVQDLAGILSLADQIVEVGPQQAAEPIEEAHGSLWGRI